MLYFICRLLPPTMAGLPRESRFVKSSISVFESLPSIVCGATQEILELRKLNFSSHGTSHITVADASGMVISLTTTVNTLFGSQVIVPSTGVIMNNEMNDFSIPGTTNAFGYIASPDNYIRPGKRPLSSISPTIVEFLDNGEFYFATGAAGGSRIITSVIQSLWHVLDQNMTSREAVVAPRFHDQLTPNVLEMELTYDNATVAYLASRGHNITRVAIEATDVQVVRRLPNGTFEAAAEPRQQDSAGLAA
jgi:gamma-glutamyltranspeptidase/glutathione hydrolase